MSKSERYKELSLRIRELSSQELDELRQLAKEILEEKERGLN